jgi:hypothetical protein
MAANALPGPSVNGARVLFTYLKASQAERLKCNECVSRLTEKPRTTSVSATGS